MIGTCLFFITKDIVLSSTVVMYLTKMSSLGHVDICEYMGGSGGGGGVQGVRTPFLAHYVAFLT